MCPAGKGNITREGTTQDRTRKRSRQKRRPVKEDLRGRRFRLERVRAQTLRGPFPHYVASSGGTHRGELDDCLNRRFQSTECDTV